MGQCSELGTTTIFLYLWINFHRLYPISTPFEWKGPSRAWECTFEQNKVKIGDSTEKVEYQVSVGVVQIIIHMVTEPISVPLLGGA